MNLVELVKEAGVVGNGGAGFPTHVKLNTKQEYFIVNAAECEPLIDTDKFLCRTYAAEIVEGIKLIGEALNAKHLVIALKGKYKEEIEALKTAINSANANIEIFEMRTFYPAGDEQTMVEQVTKRSIGERGLPSDVGCVVDNVATVYSIYNATKGIPAIEKYFSIVGEVEKTIIMKAPIGTHIIECLDIAKPKLSSYSIVVGGPMMGRQLVTEEDIKNAVITKTTGNIIVLPKDHYIFKRGQKPIEVIKHEAKSACIQCRMCTDLCPRKLIGHRMNPHKIMRNFWRVNEVKDNDEFKMLYGEAVNCCSCGVCELFSCPMGLSPRKVNDYIKVELRNRNITVDKLTNPIASEFVDIRKVPTDRLIARINLTKYSHTHARELVEYKPKTVFIPFSQHIGKPAECIKNVNDKIKKGELLAKAVDGGISANIHSSIDGTIVSITDKGAIINGSEV